MWYLIWYVGWALWVAIDGFSRGLGTTSFLWAAATFSLGPIVLPVYIAKRPLKVGEVRRGGITWNIGRNFTILWTLVMGAALASSLITIEKLMSAAQNEAQRSYLMAGTMRGLSVLGAVWLLLTAAALVVALFSRNISICERGPNP